MIYYYYNQNYYKILERDWLSAARFVYVIGLHAVQFGNNWMKKIPRTAKMTVRGIF